MLHAVGSSLVLTDRQATALNSCGWSKVGVRFSSPLPLAHNKICALEGGGLLRAPVRWMWEEGRGVMDNLARYLLRSEQ